jgi:hypothetical protein
MRIRRKFSLERFTRLLLVVFSAMSLNVILLQQSKAETLWAPVSNSKIPNNAIKNDASSDLGFSLESPLFICRHQGRIGTFFPKVNNCLVVAGSRTVSVDSSYVEILTSTQYAWIDFENHQVPANSVMVSGASKKRYVCRAFVEGSFLFGNLNPETGKCVVAADSKVVSAKENIFILTTR